MFSISISINEMNFSLQSRSKQNQKLLASKYTNLMKVEHKDEWTAKAENIDALKNLIYYFH